MAQPIYPSVPMSIVQLYISCNDLLDRDIYSKSDPCVAVYYKNTSGRWIESGRTERIKNCLNPVFSHSIEIEYYFEEVQDLKFRVFDIDNKSQKLDDDDFLGEMTCTLGQIVSMSPFSQKMKSEHGKYAGNSTLTVTAEELKSMKDVFHMKCSAKGLDNKDFLGKSDPYLEFLRQTSPAIWQVVHRTEVIKNNLNPIWQPITLKAQKLSGGKFGDEIKICCYDYDDDGSHDFIGHCMTTITALSNKSNQQLQWDCINPKKKAKKSDYKNSGTIFISCTVTQEYSFLDFITGGLQLNFTIGIDFTASNGNPLSSTSLHYMDPYNPNDYIKAIQSVGLVIQDYDHDKLFPVLGFGARIPPKNEVSHEFAVNFDLSNPFCAGIQGVICSYQKCLASIQLYGPTNFSPIIYHAAKFGVLAHNEKDARNYLVLLIITDGVISDINETLDAIVYASGLPLSIIIVGVGDANFEAMNILDGDGKLLKGPISRKTAMRDIVQFVPFSKFHNSPKDLAKEVLAEVPNQVSEYYRLMNIQPFSQHVS